jgi:hypothetical protein
VARLSQLAEKLNHFDMTLIKGDVHLTCIPGAINGEHMKLVNNLTGTSMDALASMYCDLVTEHDIQNNEGEIIALTPEGMSKVPYAILAHIMGEMFEQIQGKQLMGELNGSNSAIISLEAERPNRRGGRTQSPKQKA